MKKQNKISLLDHIPSNLSLIAKVTKVQKKASSIGFDWMNEKEILFKIKEEIDELEKELDGKNKKKVAEELGDIMFSVINLARYLKLDAESVLTQNLNKFIRRFKKMELHFYNKGKDIRKSKLEEMEKIWNKVKD